MLRLLQMILCGCGFLQTHVELSVWASRCGVNAGVSKDRAIVQLSSVDNGQHSKGLARLVNALRLSERRGTNTR